MKGIAALVTLLLLAFFYISDQGYEKYVKKLGHATYEAGPLLSKGATDVKHSVPDAKTVLKNTKAFGESIQAKASAFMGAINKAPYMEQASSTATSTEEDEVTHISTPKEVRAVYMSSWVAGTPSIRNKIIKLIDETELNAVVIDVKDNTGLLSWNGRISDLDNLLKELHEKNIYVIARVAAFQDPLFVKSHPELAVRNSKTGDIWRDHKGVPWVDTGSQIMWDYLVDVSRESYRRGFDEINLDYIRFPTDGQLALMTFPASGDRAKTDKRGIVADFYKYITTELHKDGIPVSGDVFGIITITKEDIPTLGQDFHDALTYFDYVAPMVYPSHFAANTGGFKNPAAHPGEIIDLSMRGAIYIAGQTASSTGMATSTLENKIRPWYQDFDMGATYTKELVRAQIDAGDKLGIGSWMLWDPSNTYTVGALKVSQ